MRPSCVRIIAPPAERGAERNALGRSRGGFSTKINARTNAEGLPIGIVITPGQAHDVTAVPALMHEIDCDPEQMLCVTASSGSSIALRTHVGSPPATTN